MSITLPNIGGGFNSTTVNENFQAIQDYINNYLLHRDGLTTGQPNQLENSLDANSNAILNLPAPIDPTSPVRLQDVPAIVASGDITVVVSQQETVSLLDGQTTVVFSIYQTTAASFNLNGPDVDNGRMVVGTDYSITDATTIELSQSYPAGTVVTLGRNSVP